MSRKEDIDAYLETVGRLEPDISMIDASAFYASTAISLKRIADRLDKPHKASDYPQRLLLTLENGDTVILYYRGDMTYTFEKFKVQLG